jgi:phage-related minor tail protein
VFKNVVKQLAAMILKALIFKALEIGLNAVSPGLGTAVTAARAVGGPVNQGKSYLVGEKGPELFSPNNSGRITTNAQTFKSQGSGGGQYGNVYNITAPGVSREEFTAGLNRSQQGAVGDVRDNALRRRK